VSNGTSTAHSKEEDDGAVVDSVVASTGLASDGLFGEDVVHDGGEIE
jgi:hypothetical protein